MFKLTESLHGHWNKRFQALFIKDDILSGATEWAVPRNK